MESLRNLIIIGGGPAALTAGIYASRANLKPLILEGSQPGGQLMGTTAVENWPGMQSVMGPQLMKDMRDHALHFGSEILTQSVVKVDFHKKPFTVWTDRQQEFKSHSIIIATGALPNRMGCPGEEEYWGKGVTTCAVCDGAFYRDRKVLIVGGGDTAMEDASFMKKFTKEITVVQILDRLTASHAMQQRILNDPSISIIYQHTVSEIEGNGTHVTGVTLKNTQTNALTKMAIDGIFVAIGLKPNTQIFQGQIDLDSYGYITITNKTHTSVPGIFAAGDVFDYRYKQAITSAASGCMAALDAERYLAENQ